MMATRNNQYAKGMRAYKKGEYNLAFPILKELAENGHSHAQVAIATMYHLGLGDIKRDEDEALKWYALAASQGNGLASNNYGTILHSRGDQEGAIQWYSKAREQGFFHSPLPLTPVSDKR